MLVNSGNSDLIGGRAALIFKGKFSGWRKQAEKMACDKRAPMCFQKSSWVDAEEVI